MQTFCSPGARFQNYAALVSHRYVQIFSQIQRTSWRRLQTRHFKSSLCFTFFFSLSLALSNLDLL